MPCTTATKSSVPCSLMGVFTRHPSFRPHLFALSHGLRFSTSRYSPSISFVVDCTWMNLLRGRNASGSSGSSRLNGPSRIPYSASFIQEAQTSSLSSWLMPFDILSISCSRSCCRHNSSCLLVIGSFIFNFGSLGKTPYSSKDPTIGIPIRSLLQKFLPSTLSTSNISSSTSTWIFSLITFCSSVRDSSMTFGNFCYLYFQKSITFRLCRFLYSGERETVNSMASCKSRGSPSTPIFGNSNQIAHCRWLRTQSRIITVIKRPLCNKDSAYLEAVLYFWRFLCFHFRAASHHCFQLGEVSRLPHIQYFSSWKVFYRSSTWSGPHQDGSGSSRIHNRLGSVRLSYTKISL